MKLERFKKNDKQKKIIIGAIVGLIVLVGGITLYRTFALYEEKKEFNVLKGRIPDFTKKVLTLAEAITSCNKDAATCLLENSELEPNELAYDDTVDNNLRYIGANPNNYVNFNGELWRIIGVMNNIEDSEGNKGSHIKIIRNESIGIYSWDNKPSGTGSSTSEYGSNDWTDSTLMKVLNSGAYWNRTSGNCPYDPDAPTSGKTIACDFSNTGLTNEAKNMIESVVWNLGSYNTREEVLASQYYTYERGTIVYNGHPTTWIGKVGLMYPSDYGYATNGGSTTDRNTCLNTSLLKWNAKVIDCRGNDWLFDASFHQWVLTPLSFQSDLVHTMFSNGIVEYHAANVISLIRPTLYLSTNVEITDGNGSQENPYQLKLGS